MKGFKERLKKVKNLCIEHKTTIKVGAGCLLAGTLYGALKTSHVYQGNFNELLKMIPCKPGSTDDIGEWMYMNLDKPEIISKIRETLKEIDSL